MAAVAAIRAALGRLGFTANAAQFITDQQGLDDLDEFAILTDAEVESLCKVVRHPGGTVPNPQAGQPPIANPGIAVPQRAENNLKLACYWIRYRQRTSRPYTAAAITLETIRSLRDNKLWEEEHKDVEAPELNTKDWPRMIELIEEWLRGCLGVTHIPLAYVIRENEDVPLHTDDPEANYSSKQDELIARAPITDEHGAHTPNYLTDRTRVWELLSELTRDQECWSYVRPAQRSRNGRLAFMGLKGHYLGQNNVDNMSTKAERRLETTTYTGEKRNWNFEKYVRMHIDQHAILEGLTMHGYAGIDNRSKVRHLLKGITTTTLDTVKTRIMSDATLRSDFNACVNLFQDFIVQQQGQSGTTRDVTISALGTKGGKDSSIEPDMTVEDRYYKKQEYFKLTPAQRLGLRMKRSKRGTKEPNKKRKASNDGNGKQKRSRVDLSKRTISAIAAAIAAKNSPGKETSDDSDNSDEDVDMKPPASNKTTNRNNPALQRKMKRT